jgi:hypothetical protein
MDHSIGMFLAGLLSGAGIGWYAAILNIHAAYGDPKDLKRDAILYKHLFFRASLSGDGDQAG